MRRAFASHLAVGAAATCLLVGGGPAGRATVVFDDHFVGDSGGMPAGWSLYQGPGTAVESGTTVRLDQDILIASDATLDPSSGTVTVTWDVAAVGASVNSLALLLGTPSLSGAIGIGLECWGEECGLVAGARKDGDWQGGGWQAPLPGYGREAIHLSLVLGPTAFSVTCETPPVSSGLVDYAAAFPSFTRDDLGTSCVLILQNDTPGGEGAFACIDRIVVDIGPPVAVESPSLGQVKRLYGR